MGMSLDGYSMDMASNRGDNQKDGSEMEERVNKMLQPLQR